MATAKLENINKFSKYGLRRRPTYQEIIGLIDENKTLGTPLPNRDATFFRNFNEGSFFDGANYLEELKDEQERLLLRQMGELLLRKNVRTAGRTFHTEKARTLPLTSPSIIPSPMDVNAEGMPQPVQQPTQAPPSTRLQQASQMNAELEQRRSQAMKRKEETAINHRGEVFKQAKPTLAEQLINIQPPRVAPQFFPIATDTDDEETKVKKVASLFNSSIPASSNQAPMPVNMDTSSKPKRATPTTGLTETIDKAGRRKVKYVDLRPDAEKREGDEIPEETNGKKSKRINKNKEKIQKRLETKMTKEATNIDDDDDDEEDTRKGSRVRKTIEKPKAPSKANITIIYETLTNAKNKNIITSEEYKEFNDVFQEFKRAKGKEKSKHTAKAKSIYAHLYPKLKKSYDDMK